MIIISVTFQLILLSAKFVPLMIPYSYSSIPVNVLSYQFRVNKQIHCSDTVILIERTNAAQICKICSLE